MADSFLEELYLEMYKKLYYYAYVRLKDEQLSQEVVQDVFVLAQEKLEVLRQSPNPQGWLIRTAGYTVLHAQRTRQLIQAHFAPLDEEIMAASPPEEELGLRELMTEEEWRLMKSVYCDGYSIKEAAGLFGLGLEACRKRLYRLKQRLRSQLREEPDAGTGGENDAG